MTADAAAQLNSSFGAWGSASKVNGYVLQVMLILFRIKKSAGSAREESKKAKATPAATHEAYRSIASIVNRAYQEPGRRLAYFLLNRGVA